MKVSLTTDFWISRGQHGYIGVTAHWISDDYKPKEAFLTFQHVHYPHTSEVIKDKLEEIIINWNISPYEKRSYRKHTKNIQKCAPYGNCTEIVQKIYKKCAKFCNSSLVETGSLFELLQILAHFLYIFCTISVQFPYGAHFLYIFCIFSYVFCMFSVRSFFIGIFKYFLDK